MKRFIDIFIFLFIFFLYFITFLMIYDTFREKKLNSQEKKAIDIFEKKVEKKVAPQEVQATNTNINYGNYTILGKIRIPKVGIDTVIIKEQTYSAMNLGAIKTYGVDLNEEGGFVISAHNFRGKSTFFYSIKNLKSGDTVSILDSIGRELDYKVYSVERNVAPTDTSYLITFEGYHVTLVTCENGGKSRIVVKAKIE